MRKIIATYLSESLMITFGDDVDDDSDLFQLGLIDSYAYVELISYLESLFDIRFSDDDILSDVVTSLSGLVSIVAEKVAEKRERTHD